MPLDWQDSGYHRWFNDPEVCAGNSHCVYPMTSDECREYLAATKDLVLAIETSCGEYEIHIGNIALQNINNLYRSADLSIIIGEKKYWGKGYGYQACKLMLDHAFNVMNLHRVALGTFATNEGMKVLARKLGFTQEGTRYQAAWKNGRYVDVIEYGLLREDWLNE